jgi:hypothetical protein
LDDWNVEIFLENQKMKVCKVYYIDEIPVDYTDLILPLDSFEFVSFLDYSDFCDGVQNLYQATRFSILRASSFLDPNNPERSRWKTLDSTGGEWMENEGIQFSDAPSEDWLKQMETHVKLQVQKNPEMVWKLWEKSNKNNKPLI